MTRRSCKSLWNLLGAVAIALCLVACDNTPSGVIGMSKMRKLLCDLYTADALVSSKPEQFATDSDRVAVKRAVFEKYGVTQRDYDSSMIWYAQNIDQYDKLMQNVVKDMQERNATATAEARKAAEAQQREARASMSAQHKRYAATGDTANLWTGASWQQILPASRVGYYTFSFNAGKEARAGDRYALDLKLLGQGTQFTIFLAADYSDGSTGFVSRNSAFSGWTNVPLQTDSTRHARRIYGYVRYLRQPSATAAYIDSVQLLRTRLSANNYGTITTQRTLAPRTLATKATAKKNTTVATQPATKPATPVRPERTHYKPKPGVNKSGTLPRK